MPYATLNTPFGVLTVFEDEDALAALEFGAAGPDDRGDAATPLLRLARRQLNEYFDGCRQTFALPLRPSGSAYQQRVWARLLEIPYGRTESYGALSATLGTAPRALAGACATNPLPILIPCHRVVAARGALGGYSGGEGVETKRALLRLEGALLSGLDGSLPLAPDRS